MKKLLHWSKQCVDNMFTKGISIQCVYLPQARRSVYMPQIYFMIGWSKCNLLQSAIWMYLEPYQQISFYLKHHASNIPVKHQIELNSFRMHFQYMEVTGFLCVAPLFLLFHFLQHKHSDVSLNGKHFDDILVKGCTGRYHFNKFLCKQWRKCRLFELNYL